MKNKNERRVIAGILSAALAGMPQVSRASENKIEDTSDGSKFEQIQTVDNEVSLSDLINDMLSAINSNDVEKDLKNMSVGDVLNKYYDLSPDLSTSLQSYQEHWNEPVSYYITSQGIYVDSGDDVLSVDESESLLDLVNNTSNYGLVSNPVMESSLRSSLENGFNKSEDLLSDKLNSLSKANSDHRADVYCSSTIYDQFRSPGIYHESDVINPLYVNDDNLNVAKEKSLSSGTFTYGDLIKHTQDEHYKIRKNIVNKINSILNTVGNDHDYSSIESSFSEEEINSSEMKSFIANSGKSSLADAIIASKSNSVDLSKVQDELSEVSVNNLKTSETLQSHTIKH